MHHAHLDFETKSNSVRLHAQGCTLKRMRFLATSTWTFLLRVMVMVNVLRMGPNVLAVQHTTVMTVQSHVHQILPILCVVDMGHAMMVPQSLQAPNLPVLVLQVLVVPSVI